MKRIIVIFSCFLFLVACGGGDSGTNITPNVTTVVKSRYTDQANGTIYDADGKISWLKNANCFGRISWPDAYAQVSLLSNGKCGLTDGSKAGDWRLPGTFDLMYIINPTYFTNTFFYNFTNYPLSSYWSNESSTNNTHLSWSLGSSSGTTYSDGVLMINYVLPVKSGK